MNQIALYFALLAKAAGRYDVPRGVIARRVAHLYRRHRIGFREALRDGLLDPTLPEAVLVACVSRVGLTHHQYRYNLQDYRGLMWDKANFYVFCAGAGLPVPKLQAVFDKGRGFASGRRYLATRDDWERFFTTDLPSEFVVKPSRSAHGLDIIVRQKSDDFDPAALFETLSAKEDSDPLQRYVIQNREQNHEAIEDLSGSKTLQCVRITTWITADNRIELPRTFFKIAVGEGATDNYNYGETGNLKANVDPATGILAKAIEAPKDGFGFGDRISHPVTAKQICGFQIPQWPAVMALAEYAARLFFPLRTIGWDIAITPRGPVLIEGNPYWDPSNDLAIGPQTSSSRQAQIIDTMKRFKSTTLA